jgi:beta-lactam-binding protein with PASTA domain
VKFRRHRPERPKVVSWIRSRLPRSEALRRAIARGGHEAWRWARRAPQSLDRLPGGKAPWLGAGLGVAVFFLGYLVAATMLFPAPIFARTIAVPQVLGHSRDDATAALQNMGLQIGTVTAESHRSADRGTVIWQDPPAAVGVPEGHAVDLVLSSGPQRIPVPDLGGYDVTLATELITAAGLQVGRTESTQAPAPAGVVINSRPPAGATLLPGSAISLVVSIGAPTISVPDLRGLTREGADSMLADAGLALGTAIRRSSDAEPGTVIGQSPAAGTLSAPGTTVNVTLARRRN